MPTLKIYESYSIPAIGATKSFTTDRVVENYEINANGGAVVLLADMNFTVTGTPLKGMTYKFIYKGGVTSDSVSGITVNFFGVALTNAQALIELIVEAYYNGTTWQVMIFSDDQTGTKSINGAEIVNESIPTIALEKNVISLDRLAPLAARGNLYRAGVGGVIEEFNAKTSAQILLGNGTDLISVPVTGDISIAADGSTSIGAGKVTAAMLNFVISANFEATLNISTAQILLLNGTPITIIASPGTGKYIEVISASATMTFVAAAYATNTTLQLIQETANVSQLENRAILVSTVTKNTRFIVSAEATAGQTQIITGAALQVKVATGNPTTGDSGISVKVLYRIVTV